MATEKTTTVPAVEVMFTIVGDRAHDPVLHVQEALFRWLTKTFGKRVQLGTGPLQAGRVQVRSLFDSARRGG